MGISNFIILYIETYLKLSQLLLGCMKKQGLKCYLLPRTDNQQTLHNNVLIGLGFFLPIKLKLSVFEYVDA